MCGHPINPDYKHTQVLWNTTEKANDKEERMLYEHMREKTATWDGVRWTRRAQKFWSVCMQMARDP